MDESHFAKFMERILEKYTVTVNKKIKEKNELETIDALKTCPECAERVQPKARVCRHCGYQFQAGGQGSYHRAVALQRMADGRRLYDAGNYAEAVRAFDAVIDLRSNYGLAYYNRAVALSKLGERRKAAADLRAAADLGHAKARDILRQADQATPPENMPSDASVVESAASEDEAEADTAETPADRQAQA